jgi:hypothetical protein
MKTIGRRWRFARPSLALAVLLLAHQPALSQVLPLRIVALSRVQAPGVPDGFLFRDFESPVLNDKGQVAFYGRVTGPDPTQDDWWGIWSDGTGSLGAVAYQGMQAPGSPDGLRFTRLLESQIAFNTQGVVVYGGLLRDDATGANAGSGIWVGTSESLSVVMRPGTLPVINRRGDIAFLGAGSGIWSLSDDSPFLVAAVGQHAPGAPHPLSTFSTLGPPALSDAGRVAFVAYATGNSNGIWSDISGSLEAVVLNNTPAPGLGNGVRFGKPGALVMSGAGDMAWASTFVGEAVTSSNDESLWSIRGGQLEIVAREGDQAPGLAEGVAFDSFLSTPLTEGFGTRSKPGISDSGQVAFAARLEDGSIPQSDDLSIWRYGDEGLQLVTRTGMGAPGVEPGVEFLEIEPPMINDSGRIAFRGLLAGPGINSGNDEGIWAEDLEGTLQLVARDGDMVDVAPGPEVELLKIRDVELPVSDAYYSISGVRGEGDSASAFNKYGQLAFGVVFVDGVRAVVVSNFVAVPEPSGMAVAMIALSIATMFSRRRTRLSQCRCNSELGHVLALTRGMCRALSCPVSGKPLPSRRDSVGVENCINREVRCFAAHSFRALASAS